MKALTLTQPWATLVAIGAKRIETRSWSAAYRGPLAIHAAKTFPAWAKDLCMTEPFRAALGWPEPPKPLDQKWLDEIAARTKALPIGSVVATCKMIHCLPVDVIPRFVRPFTEQEQAFGDYAPGRFGFLLEDVKPTPEPVAVKGALGFWEWDGKV